MKTPTPEQVERMMIEKMSASPQSLNSAKTVFDTYES